MKFLSNMSIFGKVLILAGVAGFIVAMVASLFAANPQPLNANNTNAMNARVVNIFVGDSTTASVDSALASVQQQTDSLNSTQATAALPIATNPLAQAAENGVLPAASFLFIILGMALAFPDLLQESGGGFSTMRICVLVVILVFAVIYVKIGWTAQSWDEFKIDKTWIYLLGLAFGAKAIQKFNEADPAGADPNANPNANNPTNNNPNNGLPNNNNNGNNPNPGVNPPAQP